MSWIVQFLVIELIAVWVSVFVLHELGHYAGFRKYGVKPKMTWENHDLVLKGNEYLTNKAQRTILWAGIITGFLPLLVYFVFAHPIIIIIYTGVYLACCSFDIKELRRLK